MQPGPSQSGIEAGIEGKDVGYYLLGTMDWLSLGCHVLLQKQNKFKNSKFKLGLSVYYEGFFTEVGE